MITTASPGQASRLDSAAPDSELTSAMQSINSKINRKLESIQCRQEKFTEEQNPARSPDQDLINELRQEIRKLERANEILRNVATYFSQTRSLYGLK